MDGPESKPEPRSMTVGDVVALVAGVAAAFAVAASLTPIQGVAPAVALATFAIRALQGLALSLAVVALGRSRVYRRMPTAAEWLTILLGGTMLLESPWFQVDSWLYAYERAFPPLDPLDLAGSRWLGAGVFTVAIAVGIGVVRLGRATFPCWLKASILAWAGLMALAGPFFVFGEQGADLISPADGFGPGLGPILLHRACMMLAGLPTGLLLGLPAVAAAGDKLRGRRWSWVEWSGAAMGCIFGFALFASYRAQGEFSVGSGGWAIERVMLLGWVVVVVLLDRAILIRLGARWRAWTAVPALPGQAPDSASAASTRWT